MAAVIGALRAELSAAVGKFADDMGKAGGAVGKFQKRFASVGKSMQKTGLVMSAAVTAPVVALGKVSLDKFQAQEKAIAAVDAALASMGPTAGFTSKQLQGMASELQKVSTFGDEDILDKVTANLLTFGQIQGDVFRRASAVALDLSARLGQDLQSSAIMLGKALNDPIRGLTALSRVGVAFTEQQREQIKAMVEAGDIAGAQAVMLAELEKQYGGQAAAQAATSAGQTQQLANAWGDFQEKVGAVIAQVLPTLVEMLGKVVEWLDTLDPQTLAWAVAIAGVAAAVGPLVLGLGTLVTGLAALAPLIAAAGAALLALGAGPLALILAPIAAVVAAWYFWDDIVAIVERVYAGVKTWMMDKLGAVFDWLKGKVEAVTGFFDDMYQAVVGGSFVPDMVDGIAAEFARLDDVMVKPAEDAARKVQQAFADAAASAGGLGAQAESAGSKAEQAFGAAADGIGGLLDDFLADGKVSFDSLRSLATDVVNQMVGIFSGLGAGGFSGGGSIGGLFSGLLTSGFSSFFAGFFAEGGMIPRGQWGIVGEDGPEPVFAGSGDLTVQPNGSMGGGVTQVFNIQTPDANSFRMSARQIARSAKQRLAVA